MNFRYFKLTGESLKAYLESEAEQLRQWKIQREALLERDDIEGYRPGWDGSVASIVFKEGKQPPGMIRASGKLPKREVRPAMRGEASREFREFLDGIKISEDCQKKMQRLLSLPYFVTGAVVNRSVSRVWYSSRLGHVGGDVYVEVPVNEESEAREDFIPPDDMIEVKTWEFVKACEEAKDYEYGECYKLEQRT